MRQELVIGGWIPGEGRRSERIGALLMGYYRDGAFAYAGRVGTGFTEQGLDELAARLEPFRRAEDPVRRRAGATGSRAERCSWSRAWWRRSSSGSGRPSG